MNSYNKKIIVSGNVVEVYNYENRIWFDFKDSDKMGRIVCDNQETKKANREKILNRARTNIRRLVNCNVQKNSKFITLTFKDNITDIKTANYEFMKFIQRLKYKLNKNFKYLTVIEFQKRGAVHYHIIFFDIAYISNYDLTNIWGNGILKINRIEDVTNVGAYVCKYMSKDNGDARLIEQKCYFTSKNLKQPIEIKSDTVRQKKISPLEKDLKGRIANYTQSFINEYNSIDYKQYILPKNKKQVL